MLASIPLGIVAKYYGLSYTLQELRDKSDIGREGVSLLGLSEAAASIGFRTVAARLSYEQLLTMPQPCILHWKDNHFVVLIQPPTPEGGFNTVIKAIFGQNRRVSKAVKVPPLGDRGLAVLTIADPASGLETLSKEKFLEGWLGKEQEGVALLFAPLSKDSNAIWDNDLPNDDKKGTEANKKKDVLGFSRLLDYLFQHRRLVIQLFVGLLVGSLL